MGEGAHLGAPRLTINVAGGGHSSKRGQGLQLASCWERPGSAAGWNWESVVDCERLVIPRLLLRRPPASLSVLEDVLEA